MEKQPDGLHVYVDGQPLAEIAEITEAPASPEGAPKVGDAFPLEVYIDPELPAKMIKIIANAAQITEDIVDRAVAIIRAFTAITADHASRLIDQVMRECNDNPRWWHLYKHSKKARIRKKYRKRLMEQALRRMNAGGSEK